MGLMDFIKKQFVDVIHWTEEDDGVLAYRFPMQDFEIQHGAQLTVRESQMALFVDEGQLADVLMPGRYELTTQTLPILTNLQNWDKGFESPFKSDVYFFSTRLQMNQKWGTSNPITIRDKEFGAVRLRVFGIYTYKLINPRDFHLQISGTRDLYTVEELEGQLRNTIVSGVTDLFAESNIPFLDMAANQEELGGILKQKLSNGFEKIGLELEAFQVQNISLPEDLQKILDQRIGMGMVGDLSKLTQYQTAQSIPTAAANEGGAAGIGAGLGAGMAMGQAMGDAMRQSMQGGTGGQQQAAAGDDQSNEDILATIEKMHGLMTKGILSQNEFEAKKAELLQKLT